jgi:hypothetical protein
MVRKRRHQRWRLSAAAALGDYQRRRRSFSEAENLVAG